MFGIWWFPPRLPTLSLYASRGERRLMHRHWRQLVGKRGRDR